MKLVLDACWHKICLDKFMGTLWNLQKVQVDNVCGDNNSTLAYLFIKDLDRITRFDKT